MLTTFLWPHQCQTHRFFLCSFFFSKQQNKIYSIHHTDLVLLNDLYIICITYCMLMSMNIRQIVCILCVVHSTDSVVQGPHRISSYCNTKFKRVQIEFQVQFGYLMLLRFFLISSFFLLVGLALLLLLEEEKTF